MNKSRNWSSNLAFRPCNSLDKQNPHQRVRVSPTRHGRVPVAVMSDVPPKNRIPLTWMLYEKNRTTHPRLVSRA